MGSHTRIVERWFEDLFTRGDLSTVDDLLAWDVMLYGQGDAEGYQGNERFKDWLRWISHPSPMPSGPSTTS